MELLLPPLGQFRSDTQKDIITAIHKNDMPGKVFVLPIAGVKSLAYIVPCLCDPAPSMTIAIIPFNAVKDEAFAKAHSAGVHTVDYKSLSSGVKTWSLRSSDCIFILIPIALFGQSPLHPFSSHQKQPFFSAHPTNPLADATAKVFQNKI
jgi:hypothetical protein